jgi:glycosyltransferase involved in cell wall biosynthesis
VKVALNGWFWNRPDTGSGQYTRHLTHALSQIASGLELTLIAPWEVTDAPDGVTVQKVRLGRRGQFGKFGFEQQIIPDVAYSIGADLLHVPYWAAPLRSPVPVVVTIHDIIPLLLPAYRGGLLARLYTSLMAATARGASAVITDSQASAADIIAELSIDPRRLYPIPLAAGAQYGPDPRGLIDMAVRKKYDLPAHYVLYLGGFDIRKNVRTLLKAYTYVVDGVGEDIPLVLAGRLPERITPRFDNIPKWIEEMKLGPYTRLIGYVEEEDKPVLYREARVFAFPSYYEGFGLPVLEAMASGTPVVASSEASLPEVVGEAGFLVHPDDARRMAGSILANITQDSTYERNRQAGLERAQTFSWLTTAERTLGVYHEVLNTAR